jgi:hypothetical protein
MNGENFDYGDYDDRELTDDERWACVEAFTLDETLDRQQHALEQRELTRCRRRTGAVTFQTASATRWEACPARFWAPTS